MFAVAGCEEQKAPETSDVRPVRTVVVNPKNVEDSRQAIGEIRPRQETELGFRVSGKLIAREVDVGDTVGKGRVLARLEEQDYRNKLQSAEADVTAAEAVLVEAQGAEGRQRKLLASGVTTPTTRSRSRTWTRPRPSSIPLKPRQRWPMTTTGLHPTACGLRRNCNGCGR